MTLGPKNDSRTQKHTFALIRIIYINMNALVLWDAWSQWCWLKRQYLYWWPELITVMTKRMTEMTGLKCFWQRSRLDFRISMGDGRVHGFRACFFRLFIFTQKSVDLTCKPFIVLFTLYLTHCDFSKKGYPGTTTG